MEEKGSTYVREKTSAESNSVELCKYKDLIDPVLSGEIVFA